MRIAYVIAYSIALLWFAGVLSYFATRPEMQGAGAGAFYTLLAVAVAPCAILWTIRRIITGGWLGRF